MDKRDEKGRFVSGNQCKLTVEQARKGGSVTKQNRIEKWIKAIEGPNCSPITKEESELIDRYLLCKTENELRKLTERKDVPIIIQARARQLCTVKTSFDATERILDRAFGKPIQKEQHSINQPLQPLLSYPEFIESLGIDTELTEEELYET